MAFQVTTFQDGMLLNIVQASSRLPHLAYISTKLFPRKRWNSKPAIFQFSKTSTCLNDLKKSLFVKIHSFMSHMLEKLHRLVGSPILHIFCKLLIPWKYVQLHYAWCYCSYLCCHPCWVSSVLKPKRLPCLLMFEIWVPFIRLQPEIQIKQISHVFSTSCHQWYHKDRDSHTHGPSPSISILHLLTLSSILKYYHTSAKDLKRISAKFRPGRITTDRQQHGLHQEELWLHWHVNSGRIDVQVPFLVCDLTIAKDPKRTPATISLSDLQVL